MRLNVYLPDEVVQELDRLYPGKSRSSAVREAIELAINLDPVIKRLDRIDAKLAGAVLTPTPMLATETPDAAEALRRTIAAEPAGFIDDD